MARLMIALPMDHCSNPAYYPSQIRQTGSCI